MSCRPSNGWNTPATLITTAFPLLIALTSAHQSISFPTPISFDLSCRIGLGRNCPGPCPTHLLRKDQSPNSPSVTVRRGGVLPVHVLKNNHVGGFSRWSLVKVSDMYNKKKHKESSFLFTCADVEVTFCTRKNQERDCKVDRMNQFFRHYLRIPKVYPDGYYVLGWMWYGGAVSTGTHGAFGDYYDCVYVRVKGGPLEESYQPMFEPGKTMTGRDGLCRATTNRVGHCFREPCPFGNRRTTLMKPEEFEGKRPRKILRKNFVKDSDKTTTSNSLQKGMSNKPKIKENSVPKIKTTPRPKIKKSPRPKIKKSPRPKIKKSPRPKIEVSPKPKMKITPRPKVKKSPKPKIESSPSPKIKKTPRPKIRISPKPKAHGTPKPTSKRKSKKAPGPSDKPSNSARPPFKPTPSPKKRKKNKNSRYANSQNLSPSLTPNSTINRKESDGSDKKDEHKQNPIASGSPSPMPSTTPTTPAVLVTLKPHRENSKKIAKEQLKREKRLRQKAKIREKRQKKMRKAEERKAKREAKRLRRKKIREEKEMKREKKRIERQRKREEKKAMKLAKRKAKRQAKRESKKSGKRSFAPPRREENNREYDDCFEEGIFPEDDGHIDYGDPIN